MLTQNDNTPDHSNELEGLQQYENAKNITQNLISHDANQTLVKCKLSQSQNTIDVEIHKYNTNEQLSQKYSFVEPSKGRTESA